MNTLKQLFIIFIFVVIGNIWILLFGIESLALGTFGIMMLDRWQRL